MPDRASAVVYTYFYLQALSWNALERAETGEGETLYNTMTAMVFSGFSLEAYLNHLGQEKVSDWLSKERRFSPKRKLEFLAQLIGYQLDFSQRPFSTFIEIFAFRNTIVHGKTARLTQEIRDDDPYPFLKPEWQIHCSVEIAKRFVDDTRTIINELHAKAGYTDSPHQWTTQSFPLRVRKR